MTNNALKRLWVLIINLYQSNIAKSTERNKAKPYRTCDQRTFHTIPFACRPKYLRYILPCSRSSVIILPKINMRGGVKIRMPWVGNF